VRRVPRAYLAGADDVYFQTAATLDEVMGEAPQNGEVYLYYSRRVELGCRPQFVFLLHPGQAPANLELVYCSEATGQVQYRVRRGKP